MPPPLRYGFLDPHNVVARREGIHTPEYLNAMVAHIRRHGVKNPILVWAKDGVLDVQSGNTRVFACRELGQDVPALIADWDNRFPNFKLIVGERAVRALYPSGLQYLTISDSTVTLTPLHIPLHHGN